MSFAAKLRTPTATIPTASMADVAFLLLVFFLVTTVFPKDRGLTLVLPREQAPVDASNVLHLVVGPSGLVEVRPGASPSGPLVPASSVATLWREAATANPRLIAAVRTAPDVAYGRMLDVLDQLHLAGAARVSLQLDPG